MLETLQMPEGTSIAAVNEELRRRKQDAADLLDTLKEHTNAHVVNIQGARGVWRCTFQSDPEPVRERTR
jgi:hypothetical protein